MLEVSNFSYSSFKNKFNRLKQFAITICLKHLLLHENLSQKSLIKY